MGIFSSKVWVLIFMTYLNICLLHGGDSPRPIRTGMPLHGPSGGSSRPGTPPPGPAGSPTSSPGGSPQSSPRGQSSRLSDKGASVVNGHCTFKIPLGDPGYQNPASLFRLSDVKNARKVSFDVIIAPPQLAGVQQNHGRGPPTPQHSLPALLSRLTWLQQNHGRGPQTP